MSSSVKRTLAEEEFATRCAPEWQRSDGCVPETLLGGLYSYMLAAACLPISQQEFEMHPCAAGRMSRKAIVARPSSSETPYSSPVKASSSSTTVANSPPTSNEVLHQVFSSALGVYTPLPSPSKRRRSRVDLDDEDSDVSPVNGQSEDRDEAMEEISSDEEEMEVERPVKPLRRSGRSAKKEVSPPMPNPLRCPGMSDVITAQQRRATVANGHGQDAPLVASNSTPQPR
ncbi:hypothetical protein F5J12DRAFT_23235 [Pisolithus orientalis]|uniref:uncharacterized protein n=1 Tax=Pisolithus orientalis TaxID=936130 RepID=UPI002224CB32|nr:uncharacterized protein F5J12DRAFT_23235 [Pisolithus orientalis]KAI6035365.1 hypothetical protein F5J12DRAFT_23235 [Pisolithus orientalis]